tara:strand:+ start:268 stop:759 length:492 start_codon:yes stop_codon:yes gene_type:complete
MNNREADLKMKDKANRELWIMEVLGTFEEPVSTKYYKGYLYVVWPEDHYRWGKDEAECYNTSNIYGECEDVITLEGYNKMEEYTPLREYYMRGDEWNQKLSREMGFPLYLLRLLEKNKINIIGDLVEKSELDLMRLRHFGRMSLRHVKESLAKLGFSLKEVEE